MEINPEFEKLGNFYYTPDRTKTIDFEAETGRIPVSGTGYRGPFSGKGFDNIWFDFSEIVRPTRDGIHGREYISTSTTLGRRLPYLQFNEHGEVTSSLPKTIDIPIPMILDVPVPPKSDPGFQLALAQAAKILGTFVIMDSDSYSEDLLAYGDYILPRVKFDGLKGFEKLLKKARIVEVVSEDKDYDIVKATRAVKNDLLVSVAVPYDEMIGERIEEAIKFSPDIIHLIVEERDVLENPSVMRQSILGVHSCLTDKRIRDQLTLLVTGGIAEASHVPKSIILGADAVGLSVACMIALGSYANISKDNVLEYSLNVEGESVDTIAQRIINMVGSWRDQLLEILGGMGLREVRRMRGELGRVMFADELDIRVFGDNK